MKGFLNMFFCGFLSFFGLSQDPLDVMFNERNKVNDADRLAEDWRNVGQYITNAYEKHEQACQ